MTIRALKTAQLYSRLSERQREVMRGGERIENSAAVFKFYVILLSTIHTESRY
jgi:hypothetical protein